MSRTLVLFAFAGCTCLLAACEMDAPMAPAGAGASPSADKTENTLFFHGIRSSVRPPGRIEFFFALRDLQDHAVLFPPAELKIRTRIYENGLPIDFSESAFFAASAESFALDVVLVLDFTNSMAMAVKNDTSAIERMLQGTASILDALGPGHRVAAYEFHDRNEEPALLVGFTADKTLAMRELNRFAASGIDHGASRVWDAVYAGTQLFPESAADQHTRLLIFLSDGFDTSSEHTPDQIIAQARARRVQIHCIGIGNLANQGQLERLARETDGLFYPAGNFEEINRQLNEIATNLRGQYRLSYISLQQREDSFTVRVEIEYQGERNSFSEEVDLSTIPPGDRDDRIGRISYFYKVTADSQATAFLRLDHTPRNIRAFKIKFAPFPPASLECITQNEGGVLDSSWEIQPSNTGWFLVRTVGEALPFGVTGLFLRADFKPIHGSTYTTGISFDNTLYANGKAFLYPDTLLLGGDLRPIAPAPGSATVPAATAFAWTIDRESASPFVFDVRLDTVFTGMAVQASGLTDSHFKPAQPLIPEKTYYWQIIAHDAQNQITGPVWTFKTRRP